MKTVQTRDMIDPEILQMLEESLGQDRANDVIQRYLHHVEETTGEAIQALEQKKYGELGKACHKLKSNVAYLGGRELEAMCVQIQGFIDHENYEAVKTLGDDFKNCCENTLSQVKTMTRKKA